MQQNWSRRLYYRLRPLHWVWPKQGDFMASVRCHSLRDGLTLWEEYMSEARTAVEQLGERALELKYEDFLAEPLPALVKLAQFCGLPADHAAVQQAAASVKQERAFAYRTNHELKQFADHEAQRLAAQHY